MIEEIDKLQDIIDKGRCIGTIDDEIGKELLKVSIEILDKYKDKEDKYNNQQEFKWKCDVCDTGFNNFYAQGFDNKIYCPLCYYKHEYNDLKQQLSQLQQENIDLKQKKKN